MWAMMMLANVNRVGGASVLLESILMVADWDELHIASREDKYCLSTGVKTLERDCRTIVAPQCGNPSFEQVDNAPCSLSRWYVFAAPSHAEHII
jgi:hypothetical protein